MMTSRRRFLGGLAVAGTIVSPLVARAVVDAGKPTGPKGIGMLVHFSDNDYSEMMMRNLNAFKGLNAELLMRSYAYVDYKNELPVVFSKIHDVRRRTQVLSECRVLVSCCAHTVAEATAAGAKAVFLATDQTSSTERGLVETLGATIVSHQDAKALRAAIRAA